MRMTTMAPEVAGGVELVRELTRRGWVISIGHTRADLKVLDDACAAGARHMTHFMNAMAPLHHRNPGPIAWGLSRDDVTVDLIADGIHLDPFMLRLLMKIKGARRYQFDQRRDCRSREGRWRLSDLGRNDNSEEWSHCECGRQYCRFSDQHARCRESAAFTRRSLHRTGADGLVKPGKITWHRQMIAARSKLANAPIWSHSISDGNVKLTLIGGRSVPNPR